ncbi:MAG: ABC transporter ATP-binding protein [Acidobacteriota bacterium]
MSAPERLVDHLSFHDLHRGFGRLRVLSGVSGEVEAGGVLLVVGHNGSGKSTLLRCLAGLMRPQRGTIACRLGGREHGIDSRRRALGYLSPDLGLYAELTTRENLDLFARLRGLDPARGGRLLDRFGLPQRRLASALSSGMRQRLRWCFALLAAPRLLLVDEPFANLDRRGRDDVLELLEERLADGALAVIADPDLLELPRVRTVLTLRLGAASCAEERSRAEERA